MLLVSIFVLLRCVQPTTTKPTVKPTTAPPTPNPTAKPITAQPTTKKPTAKPTALPQTPNPTNKPTSLPPTPNPTNRVSNCYCILCLLVLHTISFALLFEIISCLFVKCYLFLILLYYVVFNPQLHSQLSNQQQHHQRLTPPIG